MTPETLERLVEARARGEAVVLATRVSDGTQALLAPLDADGDGGGWPVSAAREALLADRSTMAETPEGDVFLRVYNPPVRVVLVGAVHVAQPLTRMTADAGYAVSLVDPRRAFATEERFPGVHLVHAWPAEGIAELAPDHRTAIVTLSHDPKLDDPALVAALESPAFYVGALGSRRTHARRLERLADAGADAEARARIRAPVGLAIGARTPEEIAVSVLAEIVAALRGAL